MTTKTQKKTCPSCGGAMKHETREDKVTYKGQSKTFEVTGWWCSSCDEAIFEGPALQVAEQTFIELRAEVESVLLPKQITAIRESLNLSQREAGKILGGGPRAFQKYEAGSVPVSAPMNNLLLLLSQDPKRLTELQHLLQQGQGKKSGWKLVPSRDRKRRAATTSKAATISKARPQRVAPHDSVPPEP